ncbi:MAG: BON domain-containing protein [Acidobacteriota bacterium]|jgi:osmotically-inducible protein OsmY
MAGRTGYAPAILAALSVLLTGAVAVAADDAAIREAIEVRLQKAKLEREADVSVVVRDGEVTLTGVATSLPASREIERLARKEAKTVDNQLRVHLDEPVKDADVVSGIRKAILGYPRYAIFDYVEFAVNEGAVLLQGSVIQPWKKNDIESLVARVPGVREIRNDIAVQSMSQFDSDLRASLARQIYGDPRFVRYAHRAQPPIRILVDRGNVTLAGWVGSPVEKAILDQIARSTLSFTVENRLHVDGEVPEEDRKDESSPL